MGQVKEMPLALPADAAAGPLRGALHAGGSPSRRCEVGAGARGRAHVLRRARPRRPADEARGGDRRTRRNPSSDSGKVALSTARWYADIYRKGQKSDVPGAYSDHPLFMVAQLSATGFSQERMQFDRELALAETLAKRLGGRRRRSAGGARRRPAPRLHLAGRRRARAVPRLRAVRRRSRQAAAAGGGAPRRGRRRERVHGALRRVSTRRKRRRAATWRSPSTVAAPTPAIAAPPSATCST